MDEVLIQVVESAAKCLRSDGVFCSFSPCMEQIQRSCGALSQAGFYNVQVIECLLRQYEVRAAHFTIDVLAPTPQAEGEPSTGSWLEMSYRMEEYSGAIALSLCYCLPQAPWRAFSINCNLHN